MQRLYAADAEKRELTDNFAYVKDELDKWQMQQARGNGNSSAASSVGVT